MHEHHDELRDASLRGFARQAPHGQSGADKQHSTYMRNMEWLRHNRLEDHFPGTAALHNIARKELQTLMAGQKYFIDADELARLTGVTNDALQTVSDAGTAVTTEIAAIPGQIQKAVAHALANAGVAGAPVDLSAVFGALANVQAGAHNIATAAQLAGATAPATPAPPVTDPITGTPVAVTDPIVELPVGAPDTSGTPTAPAAAAGTDGTGQAAPDSAASSDGAGGGQTGSGASSGDPAGTGAGA